MPIAPNADRIGIDAVEPEAGFEPATYALRVRCSTPELPRQVAVTGERA